MCDLYNLVNNMLIKEGFLVYLYNGNTYIKLCIYKDSEDKFLIEIENKEIELSSEEIKEKYFNYDILESVEI